MSENSTILKDMVVVVTGAAQGIGRAYAMALAGAGASVAICDISDPSAVVAELKSKGCRCLGSRVDISRADQIECFIDEVESELGPIGGLVNNEWAR